jgi:three-Cys-motif partner protein
MSHASTLWQLEPHTLGKHLVLRRYLDAWLPIMSSWAGRVLFIDGFAGPGEYQGGEEGSPIIAIRAFADHASRASMDSAFVFVFIEKEANRADHLRTLLTQLPVPANATFQVINGVFDETLASVLDDVDAQLARLAPCFVMVDPFGVAGTPMSVLRRILSNRSSELYISFMYEAINRFATTPEFEPHLDQLFGTPDWRACIGIVNPDVRKACLYDLYENQLRQAGAAHVIRFELYQGQRLVYAIFFATQHHKGCDKMKQAIWKVVPFGDFAFRAAAQGQLAMSLSAPDFGVLQSALLSQFRGKGWITIQDLEMFVSSDKTLFHTGHLRKCALVPLEDSGSLRVDPASRKKRHTYPPGTRVLFP